MLLKSDKKRSYELAKNVGIVTQYIFVDGWSYLEGCQKGDINSEEKRDSLLLAISEVK